ncbi:alpha/beta hydrolase [Granulicoccus sp. GXG6511]|uniref:alpha/beta hydrolase n=1 Tax=Granulicoccus sp. GXG6511 TaxID=3381351 RepID=UPI003D7EBC75
MTQREWQPDLLVGFEQCLLPLERRSDNLGGDPETGFGAVLVRSVERPHTGRAVLYVHGWNDYFFQRHVAEFWVDRGYAFYALDLRRYGRSWVEGQLRGFTTDLSEYFEELDQAVVELNSEHDELVLMGHSTGGLIAALYAHERPGVFTTLVLNSPWLDLQGGPLARALGPVIKTLGGQRPTTIIPPSDADFYRRTIHASEGGEWDYDLGLKSAAEALIRVGWLKAVLQGHARIAEGLTIQCPVLVLASARSDFSRKWSEQLKAADVVLDVEQIAKRAVRLGPVVTVVRIEDALHDVFLSPPAVRDRAFAEIARWLRAYAPVEQPATP